VISEDQLRQAAARWRIDLMIVDLDYVLGCLLSQWSLEPATAKLRFKGGTCLRKCYFPDYRFSEDLDFTAEEPIDVEEVGRLAQRLIRGVGDAFGIDMAAAPPLFRKLTEAEEEGSVEARLYYRGPLRRTGAPQAIRLHISMQEHLGFPSAPRPIHHPYPDRHVMQPAEVHCYDLREVLAEKLRAVSGQRKHAISRDLYDLHSLLTQGGLSLDSVEAVLAEKFAAKGLDLGRVKPGGFSRRRREFESDWHQNLIHLVPPPAQTAFDDAWRTADQAVAHIAALA
jgi:predicted nucleotidyltransferase component of viral defense system